MGMSCFRCYTLNEKLNQLEEEIAKLEKTVRALTAILEQYEKQNTHSS